MKSYVLRLIWRPTPRNQSNPLFFDGVAYDDTTIPITDKSELDPSKLTESILHGEWVAATSDRDQNILIRTDTFGFYHLFYTTPTLNQNGLGAASNNFEALVRYLTDQGCHPELDIGYAAPLMLSNSPLFNQAYSKRTCCTQINRLLPGETIRLTPDKIHIDKGRLLDPGIIDNYDDLIDSGVNSCYKQLSAFQVADNIRETTIFLSGGKDSRACLSLLLAQPGVDFSCSTHAPSVFPHRSHDTLARDFSISCQLAAHFDLKWSRPTKKEAIPLNFIDTLSSFRADRSNKYYYFNPAAFFTRSMESGFIAEIRGGAGEALRSYWGNYFRKLKVSSRFKLRRNNIAHDAAQVFQALVPKEGVTQELYRASTLEFVRDIEYTCGEDIYDSMDIHYILHRNRYHFGNVRRSYAAGIVLYYPLAQIDFLRASRLLGYGKRSEGKVIYDIINRFYPILHSFEYESGFFECATQPNIILNPPAQKIREREREHLEIQTIITQQNKNLYRAPRLYNIQSALESKFQENIQILTENSMQFREILQEKMKSSQYSTNTSASFVSFFTKVDGMAQVYEPHQEYTTVAI